MSSFAITRETVPVPMPTQRIRFAVHAMPKQTTIALCYDKSSSSWRTHLNKLAFVEKHLSSSQLFVFAAQFDSIALRQTNNRAQRSANLPHSMRRIESMSACKFNVKRTHKAESNRILSERTAARRSSASTRATHRMPPARAEANVV